MTTVRTTYLLILIGLFCVQNVRAQNGGKDILISFVDTVKDEYGYTNLLGDTIIPLGKYSICFTDTFGTYAIVAMPHKGFVAIDRHENILYNVFPIDNGPDYVSDGLFRVIIDNKIGFAESTTGKIVINPQFTCAWQFEDGIAKVSTDCKTQYDGNHSTWLSDNWYYIDKKRRKVNSPKTK